MATAVQVVDDSGVQWLSAGVRLTSRASYRALASAVMLGFLAVVSLDGIPVSPAPNGLGLLPSTVVLLGLSGLTLQTPVGSAATTAAKAATSATSHQPRGVVEQVVLATAVGPAGSAISSPGRLCWVVFLNPGPDSLGNLPAPGQIMMDTVLVDAHTGAVIEGFISFQGSTPNSFVGTE